MVGGGSGRLRGVFGNLVGFCFFVWGVGLFGMSGAVSRLGGGRKIWVRERRVVGRLGGEIRNLGGGK